MAVILQLLSPMVPHFTAEMWQLVGEERGLEKRPWPLFDAEAAKEDQLTIVIQVNGKVRSRLQVPADIADKELIALVMKDQNTVKFLEGNLPKKTIVVKKKLVNIVV